MGSKFKKVYLADDKCVYRQVTGWIKLNNMAVTDKSSLYDYADSYTDENGCKYVDMFRVHNKRYCVGQFMHVTFPISVLDDNKEIVAVLSGYDYTTGLDPHPYYIELDPNGYECVRVWEYVGSFVNKMAANETIDYVQKIRKGRA